MNYFVLGGGLLYLGAAVQYFWQGNAPMGFVFISYAVANFTLTYATYK